MTEPTTELLIDRLAGSAEPVRPLAPPMRRAARWIALALTLIIALVWIHGPRPDLAQQMARLPYVLEWAASLTTGILAAVAAFHLALPDRSPRWLWLAAGPAMGWLATLGAGCVADWVQRGPDGFVITTSFHCVQVISTTSLPLIALLLVMLRHAARIRPVETMAAGGLAAAAFSATALGLFHHLDAAVMILIWHLGTVSLLVLTVTLVARPLMRLVQPRVPSAV